VSAGLVAAGVANIVSILTVKEKKSTRVLGDRRGVQRVISTIASVIRVDSYMDKQLNKKRKGLSRIAWEGGSIRGDEQGPKRAGSVWVRLRGA